MEEIWATWKGSIGDTLFEIGVRLLMAAALLIIGRWLSRKLLMLLQDANHFKQLTPSTRSFLHSFMSILLKCFLVVLIIAALGVPMASIVAVIGSVGLAIGLALQGTLQNIAGGLIIMIFKPFQLGDYLTTGEHAGTVTEIGVFFTELTTIDNRKVIVPNAQVSNKEMVNAVSGMARRVDVTVAASYGTRAEDVFAALQHAANTVPEIKNEPAPSFVMSAYADSAIMYQAMLWCDGNDVLRVRYAFNEAVKRAFEAEDISFPFPQLDVHVVDQTLRESTHKRV